MIREYLKEHILITDGAMGTYYDRKKSENGRIAEEANLLEPELITRIHEEYLEQGARLHPYEYLCGKSCYGTG